MRLTFAAAVVTLLLGATLVGCGGGKPAVCSSVDNLKTSIDNIKDIDLHSSSAVNDLQSGLKTIEGDIAKVKTDAKSEFSSQIDAVDAALATVKTSVDAAKAAASATTLAAVAAAVSPFEAALETLISDVKSTC
jgi:hypothetical protein